MANNKVIFGNEVLIDISQDTVSAQNLLQGATAHDKSGASITGGVVVEQPSFSDDTIVLPQNCYSFNGDTIVLS